jgi:hypothetical protein
LRGNDKNDEFEDKLDSLEKNTSSVMTKIKNVLENQRNI